MQNALHRFGTVINNSRKFLRVDFLNDLLYPRICPGCGQHSDRPGRFLCWSCFSTVELLDKGLCDICGNPLAGDPQARFLCDYCRTRKPAFDRARSAARFNGVVRDMLHSFKYKNALWLAEDISDIMYGALTVWFDVKQIDVVVPVPLFRTRQRERSYNQARVLADILARRLDRRLDEYSLRRIRATETQTHYNSAQRRTNIRGAFKVTRPRWVKGRKVLLVDDVMTTGATLNACAKELKDSGARQILAISAARR